ncbi:MAG: dihydroxyacetone kinase subunit L [Caldilineaceae bacterium]|nr:dihydroxyacetone kinase subunit L [Caldilineaceae bacterium]
MAGEARAEQVVRLSLQKALDLISANEQELGRLDAAAGDGDHGAAMVRGLRAAVAAIDGAESATPGELLVQAGMAFADAGGGASGALFGSAIATLGQQLGPGPYNSATVAAALQAVLKTVSTMGKAKPGDKTMIDALAPFVEAIGEATDMDQELADAWRTALPAAEAGAKATASMVARRGRSARLGDRSLGHQDPGSVSMVYLLRAASDALTELCGSQ